MKDCGSPVGDLPAPQSIQSLSSTQPQMFTDILPAAMQQQNPAADVLYAVEVLNRDGRSAGLSNRVAVLAAPTLPPPPDFHADLAANGVEFSWTSAGDASPAANIQHRYRIYRRNESTGKDAIAMEIPAGQAGVARGQDSSFEWEKTYSYRLTSVTIVNRTGGESQVEGDDSTPIRIVAHDVFPPGVPSGVQAVYSGEGQQPFIDLVWGPVTDADLAGYNIYRHEDDQQPVKLNSDIVKAPSYRDRAVAEGKTYFYSVSAVDARGNESGRSEEASETVP